MVSAVSSNANVSAMPWRAVLRYPITNFQVEVRLYGFKENQPQFFAIELFAKAPGRDEISIRHFSAVAPKWMRSGYFIEQLNYRAKKWAICVLKRATIELVERKGKVVKD
jgi:hypothetical protein